MKRILKLLAGICVISVLSGFTFKTPKMHPFAICVRNCLNKNFSDSSCTCNATCRNSVGVLSLSGDEYDEGLAMCTVQCEDTCRLAATVDCRSSCAAFLKK
jgi:hypothetical protein